MLLITREVDYVFLKEKLNPSDTSEYALKVLKSWGRKSSNVGTAQVQRKGGEDEYAVAYLVSWLKELGWKSVILPADPENAAYEVCQKVAEKRGEQTVPRAAPKASKGSLGGVGGAHSWIAGQIRTMLFALRDRYPTIKIPLNHHI